MDKALKPGQFIGVTEPMISKLIPSLLFKIRYTVILFSLLTVKFIETLVLIFLASKESKSTGSGTEQTQNSEVLLVEFVCVAVTESAWEVVSPRLCVSDQVPPATVIVHTYISPSQSQR